MAIVQIDDGIYLDALQYIWCLEGKSRGWGTTFENWVKEREPEVGSQRRDELSRLLASVMGHYSGGAYDPDSPWDADKTLVWSFFRAWLDRDEMNDKPSDHAS